MKMTVTHSVRISPKEITLDGKRIETEAEGLELLTSIYRKHIGDYPKFFKMDALCRLGFVATELLLEAEGLPRFESRDDRAVAFFNRSSSLWSDSRYQQTICEEDDYFPSPAQFVYTLPNIVTGEIAIRNKYFGETSFYVVESRDDRLIEETLLQTSLDGRTASAIGGWLECADDNAFEAEIYIVEFNNKK